MFYTQLRSFHAVAQEGGFTAAARALNISQPTVTIQIRNLEDYFGVELFLRRGRKVQLTETGQALLTLTRRLLEAEAEAIEMLKERGDLRGGTLRVAAVGPYHVTEMLALFNERYPEVKVMVETGNSQEALAALHEFRVDVAVLAQVREDPSLLATPYSRHEVVVFTNLDHPFAQQDSLSIEDLAGQRMVLRERGSTTRLALEEALEKAKIGINPVMEIGSREAVWMAVQRGIGIGVVSDIEFVPHPELKTLRLRDAEVYTYAHVVCLAERSASQLIKAFFDVVRSLTGDRVNY